MDAPLLLLLLLMAAAVVVVVVVLLLLMLMVSVVLVLVLVLPLPLLLVVVVTTDTGGVLRVAAIVFFWGIVKNLIRKGIDEWIVLRVSERWNLGFEMSGRRREEDCL